MQDLQDIFLKLRWEFIKEKQENKNSTKKATKKKEKTFFFSWSLS